MQYAKWRCDFLCIFSINCWMYKLLGLGLGICSWVFRLPQTDPPVKATESRIEQSKMDPLSIEMSLYSHSGLNGSGEWAQFCGATQMDATKSAANKICQLAVGLSIRPVWFLCTIVQCSVRVFWVETREEGRGGIPALPRASGKPASVEGEDPAHPQATKCIRGQQLPPFLAQLPALTAFLARAPSRKRPPGWRSLATWIAELLQHWCALCFCRARWDCFLF